MALKYYLSITLWKRVAVVHFHFSRIILNIIFITFHQNRIRQMLFVSIITLWLQNIAGMWSLLHEDNILFSPCFLCYTSMFCEYRSFHILSALKMLKDEYLFLMLTKCINVIISMMLGQHDQNVLSTVRSDGLFTRT